MRILSLAATRDFWLARDACPEEPAIATGSLAVYAGCAAETSLAIFTPQGVGHLWPRTGEYTLNAFGLDLTELVARYLLDDGDWQALAQTPLPTGDDAPTPRSYLVYVPPETDPATPMPVVVALHGRPGNGAGMAYLLDGNRIAREEGFILVYPDGVNQEWNSTLGFQGFQSNGVNDTAFLTDLIDDLGRDLNIDHHRVYAFGFSNGGFMAQRLACEATGTFAGFGFIGASLFAGFVSLCADSPPVPVFYMHGTLDASVAWTGITQGDMTLYLPALDTVAFWLEHNGCSLEVGDHELLSDPTADATTIAHRYTFASCPPHGDVEFIAIEGGGHNLPGVANRLDPQIAGRTNMDINAMQILWDFFSRQSLERYPTSGARHGPLRRPQSAYRERPIDAASRSLPMRQSGRHALRALLGARSPLAALQAMHHDLGDVFRLPLPGFSPVVLVGPEAARFVLVEARGELRWRNDADPVTRLLRHGLLVEDGESHDALRRLMLPALHKRMLAGYVEAMWRAAAQVSAAWDASTPRDMLVEARRMTLLILMEALYAVDFAPDLDRLWQPILSAIAYISPGPWIVWPGIPRPQYRRTLARLDDYLYAIIRARKQALAASGEETTEAADLLGLLVQAGLDDDLIRDQLLTMLIAGHDTSTALLAWSLYLLGAHPEALRQAQAEVRAALADCPPGAPPSLDALNQMPYLSQIIREALRLYPPIHMGARVAAADLAYGGYAIPAGQRVIYSIYLTQRDPRVWPAADQFRPERHAPGQRQEPPYAWLAFGGGPRNCIGAAFGQLEVKVILAYLLNTFALDLLEPRVHVHMGATLEPRPGVRMAVRRLSRR